MVRPPSRRELDPDDVLDRVARDRNDHEPGERLRDVQRGQGRLKRGDKPVRDKRGGDTGAGQDTDRERHRPQGCVVLDLFRLALAATQRCRHRHREHDEQYDPGRGQRWGRDGVKARHGVHPAQIADYLALCGDAVDNIPGITGIGAKSAAVLLAHFDTLDALLERNEEVAFLRIRGAAQMAQRLREQREHALLWRQLTTIALDAPLPEGSAPFARGEADAAMLDVLVEGVGFGNTTRKRLRAIAGLEQNDRSS